MNGGGSCISGVTLYPYVQSNVIPVMFGRASGRVGRRGGDVAVWKAGLTDVSLARLGGPFAVLRKQTRTTIKFCGVNMSRGILQIN